MFYAIIGIMPRFRASRLSAALRGVLVISSGTLLGQIIIAAATPVISRMYSPDAFGAYSAVLAVASTIGPAAALKFDSAILLPQKDQDAKGVLILSLLTTVIISVLSGIAMWLIGPIAFANAWESVPFASFWVGAIVLTTGTFSCLVQAVLRSKAYGLVGWRATIQSACISAAQIGFGLIGPHPAGLLGGTVAGRLAGFSALARGARALFRSEGGESLRTLLRRYWRSPLILAPSSLLNALGTQMPLVILAAWFGSAAAGQLGMAQRLVFLPAALIGAALAQVFRAEIAQRLRDREGGARSMYLSASLRISGVALLVCVAILLLAPTVMPWILGSEWEQSGQLAQAMAISASLGLVVSPLSQVYAVYQSRASLVVDFLRVVFVGGAGAIAWWLELDVLAATWMLYSGQVLNYLVTWAYGLRITSRAARDSLSGEDL